MIKNILFDLDGTLLPMDEKKFMKLYFRGLMTEFSEVDPQLLHMAVMKGTNEVREDSSDLTNLEVFAKSFVKTIPMDKDAVMERFYHYYETGFSRVKEATWVSQAMLETVRLLKQKGYRLFIATNPLFPLLANHQRIIWAGLSIEDFDHVSCLEKNHFCKPNLKFYKEYLEANELVAEESMMVGNDTYEDMVATRLGLSTYLITDCQINDNDFRFKSDHVGTAEQFLNFVKTLPDLS